MSTEIERLEANLRESPGDRESWLVYADWLLEQNDARGRLIQLEQQLETEPSSAADRVELRSECAEIERAGTRTWLKGWRRPANARLRWRSGFVVGLTLERFSLAAVGSLYALQTGRILRSLAFHGTKATEDELRHLAHDPALAPLRDLDLSGIGVTPAGAALLASSPSLSPTSLALSYTPLGDDGVGALAGGSVLSKLTRLVLVDTGASTAGLQALTRSETLGSIRQLILDWNPIGADAAALADLTSLSALRELSLTGCPIGDAGTEALSRAELHALTELNLAGTGAGVGAARALASAQALSSLVALDLSGNPLGDEGAAALAASTSLGALRTLDLRGCLVTMEGVWMMEDRWALHPDCRVLLW